MRTFAEKHIPFIKSYIRKYKNKGIPYSTLLSEAMIASVRAEEAYDPSLGFEFSTFASKYIRAAICEQFRRQSIRINLREASEIDNSEDFYSILSAGSENQTHKMLDKERRLNKIRKLVSKLDDRRKYIMTERFLKDDQTPRTTIAKKLGVSFQRVAELEKIIIKQFRKELCNA